MAGCPKLLKCLQKINLSDEDTIQVMENPWMKAEELIQSGQQDSFFLFDVTELVNRHYKWLELLPRVKPFYAVKCNYNKILLRTLAALGAGFDCASKNEIDMILDMGVHPEQIIYANPTKMPPYIKHAEAAGVFKTTFDSKCELVKLKHLMPQAKTLLRIKCDELTAKFSLGKKFGCDPVTEGKDLLKLASELNIEVVGISFHVGSDITNYEVFARAIHLARGLFDVGIRLGHSMRLLDIGGGFPGHDNESYKLFKQVAAVINKALAQNFPEDDVEIIAEPGRYYATAPFTLFASVHTVREVTVNDELHIKYYLNDGVYGSFNSQLYRSDIECELYEPKGGDATSCSIWGPTCDSLDCITPSTRLPVLGVGDWLVFRNMGAYSSSCSSEFNGFSPAKTFPIVSRKPW